MLHNLCIFPHPFITANSRGDLVSHHSKETSHLTTSSLGLKEPENILCLEVEEDAQLELRNHVILFQVLSQDEFSEIVTEKLYIVKYVGNILRQLVLDISQIAK